MFQKRSPAQVPQWKELDVPSGLDEGKATVARCERFLAAHGAPADYAGAARYAGRATEEPGPRAEPALAAANLPAALRWHQPRRLVTQHE